jgi:hypothetical protein
MLPYKDVLLHSALGNGSKPCPNRTWDRAGVLGGCVEAENTREQAENAREVSFACAGADGILTWGTTVGARRCA